jgi:hypothetical protein
MARYNDTNQSMYDTDNERKDEKRKTGNNNTDTERKDEKRKTGNNNTDTERKELTKVTQPRVHCLPSLQHNFCKPPHLLRRRLNLIRFTVTAAAALGPAISGAKIWFVTASVWSPARRLLNKGCKTLERGRALSVCHE